MAEYRIGISGWRYVPWRKSFYPEDLPQKNELAYASRQVNSIEINGTFYALQRESSFHKWYDETPEDFVFSVKANRYITHIRRLLRPEEPLARFLASGVLSLKQKLGPFLWQFPPNFKYERERFEHFLKLLPRGSQEAARFARRQGERVSRTSDFPLRHCVEIRHPSFMNEEFIDLLRENNTALVFADSAGKWPYSEDLTSDFCYFRLHGEGQMYVGGYDDECLDYWAKRMRLWKNGKAPRDAKTLSKAQRLGNPKDIYVYFDNDVKVRAPFDAVALLRRLTDFEPAVAMEREPNFVQKADLQAAA